MNEFYTWWVAEHGSPPEPHQSELYESCRKAFDAGRSGVASLSFDQKRDELSEVDPDMLLADGYEGALVGYCIRFGREPIAIYDIDRCIEILMTPGEGDFEHGMTFEEAHEWFSFNTLGAWLGDYTPAFLKRCGTE